jgi:hypothetical protein
MTLLQQMAQDLEQKKVNDVVAELRRRGVFDERCPRCKRSTNWGANFFQMPVAPTQAPGFYIAEQLSTFFPVVSLTCTNCGYMVYHNLKVLGLDK